MKYLETLIAKIEIGHWLLLSQQPEGGWAFEIWGTFPLTGSFGVIGDEEAKELLFCVAKPHLEQHGLAMELADVSDLSWRVAVRQEYARSQGEPQRGMSLQPSWM